MSDNKGWNDEPKPNQVSMAVAGILITILALVALVLIFALIGALAAIVAESYQWFRVSLNWV